MNRWKWMTAGTIILCLSLLHAGVALAQNGEDPPIMSALLVPAQIAVRAAILMNELLGFWVTGNYTLSDPLGEMLIEGLGSIIPQLADFWSQVLSIF
jgi:hypothetical protein